MTQLVNYLGLATAEFKMPASAVLVPTTTRLYTIPSAPEGVLFKQVSNLTEALDSGGLMMIDAAKPSKWMFLVGKSLVAAIQAGRLDLQTDVKRVAPHFKAQFPNRLNGVYIANGAVYQGFEIEPFLVDYSYFGPTDSVLLCGVACSATEGVGYSDFPAFMTDTIAASRFLMSTELKIDAVTDMRALSYMSTEIEMATTFADYMTKVKLAAIDRAPEDVRSYYERTFDQTLATYDRRLSRPSISIPTFWLNGFLATVNMPRYLDRPCPGSSFGDSVFTGGFMIPTKTSAVSSPVSIPAGTPTGAAKSKNTLRPGFKSDEAASPHVLPYMGYFDKGLTQGPTLPLATGTMAGLKAGLMRDGHVLARAIITGTRFADTPSTVNELGTFLADFLDGIEVLQPEGPVSTAIEVANLVTTELARPRSRSNIYFSGTLPGELARFSDAWDNAAKALAQSEN